MKKLILVLTIILASCSSEETSDYTVSYDYEKVNYVTLTNENTGGGSQKAYLTGSTSLDQIKFCYCDENCSREVINVAEIQLNEATNEFRFKKTLSDPYTIITTNNWCTQFD
tara:strand:+ start:262 stop:597 length:336 start_codon:yes stop_codon:yes gene_type:complete